MNSEKRVKIYISTHKPCDYVKNELFTLVQAGAALPGTTAIPDAVQDNTGDNISDKNPRFCELTTQYWAWKNQDADYYGFFHYRRYLSFAENNKEINKWGYFVENNIDNDEFTANYGLQKN